MVVWIKVRNRTEIERVIPDAEYQILSQKPMSPGAYVRLTLPA